MHLTSDPSSESPLKFRVASAIVWTAVRFGGDIVTNLVIFIIMARILDPSQFGAFAVAIVFAEIGRLAVTNGLVSSVLSSHALDDCTYNTIFWGNLGVGLLFAFVGVIGSSVIADALGFSVLSHIIASTSLIVPITALGATHTARNLRAFGHRTLAIRTVVAGLVGSVLTIAAAMNGFGVWSFVVQRLTVEIVYAATAWLAFRWIPEFQISWSILRTHFVHGMGVLGAQTVALGLNKSQDIILGQFLGLGAVGIYRTGWKVVEQLIQGLISPFSAVSVLVFNKFAENSPDFERSYLTTVRVCAGFAFPAIVGFSCVADLAIPLIFGEKWLVSVPLAQVLGLLFIPATLNFFVEPVLLVQNRPGILLIITLFQIIFTLSLSIFAAPFGLFVFACAYVVRSYIMLFLQMYFLQSAANLRIILVFQSIQVPIFASAVMAVAVVIFKLAPVKFDANESISEIIRLAAMVSAGIVIYVCATLIAIGKRGRVSYLNSLISVVKYLR